MLLHESDNFSTIPEAESSDPQVEDLYHGKLVLPPCELALK